MKKDKSLEFFCWNIRFLRHEIRLSKKEMAKKLKIGVKTLTKIEAGIVPPRLSSKIIETIHREFKVIPSALFSPNFQTYFAAIHK